MNRIDRLFGILVLMQSRKFISAEDIADRFGISIRTVYRDLKAMCEQGIPVSFEPQKGYGVVQGYFLPPVSFNTDEANALVLIESIVHAFADKSILAHYSSALNKVKTVLRSSQKEKLEKLNDNIMMQAPACFTHDYEYLSTIQNAIASRFIIEMDYTNNQDISSRRLIEPIGLIFYALNWHLIAWCHNREDYRDFKVARIKGVRETGRAFTRQAHMELKEYMKLLPVNY